MSLNYKLISWIFILIFLVPIIFFPFSGDLSVIWKAACTIAEGKKIYVDFIDIKPPFIYYLLAGVRLIFGNSELSPRIFDFFVQILTCYSIIKVVKSITENEKSAYYAAILYSIAYSSLNFSNTVQCESFSPILIIWIIYFQFRNNHSFFNKIVLGVLIGLLTGLKYTFGIAIFAVLLYDFFYVKRLSKFIFSSLILVFSFILSFALTLLPLIDGEILAGYLDVLKYTAFYGDFPPLTIENLRMSIKNIGVYFGDVYSISYLFLTASGIYITWIKFKDSNNGKFHSLANFLLLTAILFFISIIIERKFITYHFQRIYIPLLIFAGFGFEKIIDFIMLNFRTQKDQYTKFILSVMIVGMLLFSPLTRYANILQFPIYYFTNKNAYDRILYVQDDPSRLRPEQLMVINFLNRQIKPNELVMIINSGGNIAFNYLKSNNITRFAHSCFYLADFKIPRWVDYYRNELQSAKWLIVQTNDSYYFLTRNYLSSYESLQRDNAINQIFKTEFDEIHQIGHFKIFKRKTL